MMRVLAVVLAAVGLAGCAASAGYAVISANTAPALVRGPDDAWASLPPAAGHIVSVGEWHAPPRDVQRILLAGDGGPAGDDAITVATLSPSSPIAAFGPPPTDEAIGRDMAEALPGVAMHRLDDGRNRLGPFSAAVGRAAPFTCLYAWQRVGGIGETAGPSGIPVDLRVRLCRRAPAAALVGYMRDLAVYVGPTTSVDMSTGGFSVDPMAALGQTPSGSHRTQR